MIKILTPEDNYIIEYPKAVELARLQSEIFWLPDEIEVEKDLHDLKTNFTEAEYHGVISTLKLFTLYELKVGNDYWRDIIPKLFPRPDIQRMAATFSFMELGVHAPFYNRINEVLGLDTPEFYNSYLEDPILEDRMKWIGRRVSKIDNHYDRLKSIGIFSMIEGAILYTSFAFLKHFQNQGKNKLINVNAGINFSAQDEDIHGLGGAWLFNQYLKELTEYSKYKNFDLLPLSDSSSDFFDIEYLYEELRETATIILEHESQIIKKIFERGSITGITAHQLENFIQSRLDICLERLGIAPIFKPEYNPIASWFYNNLNSSILHDFFVKQGSDYNRNWNERKFIW